MRENIETYWAKVVWPANSSDPFPIENVCAVMQDKVDKVNSLPSTLTALEKILKEAWAKISPEGLKNLALGIYCMSNWCK